MCPLQRRWHAPDGFKQAKPEARDRDTDGGCVMSDTGIVRSIRRVATSRTTINSIVATATRDHHEKLSSPRQTTSKTPPKPAIVADHRTAPTLSPRHTAATAVMSNGDVCEIETTLAMGRNVIAEMKVSAPPISVATRTNQRRSNFARRIGNVPAMITGTAKIRLEITPRSAIVSPIGSSAVTSLEKTSETMKLAMAAHMARMPRCASLMMRLPMLLTSVLLRVRAARRHVPGAACTALSR
jgi:hypothetical protein